MLALVGCSVFPDHVELPDAAGVGAGGSSATVWDASILNDPTDAATSCPIRTVVVRAVADTYLSSDYSDRNYGSDPEMLVGHVKSNEQRLLVNFDLGAALATGFDVTAMRLVLTVTTPGNGAHALSVYPVSMPWSESEATWVDAASGNAWSSSGGDFGGSPIATATVPRNASAGDSVMWSVPLRSGGIGGMSTSDFANGGSSNTGSSTFGWLVQSADPSGDVPTVAFATREATSGVPRLELDVLNCE